MKENRFVAVGGEYLGEEEITEDQALRAQLTAEYLCGYNSRFTGELKPGKISKITDEEIELVNRVTKDRKSEE